MRPVDAAFAVTNSKSRRWCSRRRPPIPEARPPNLPARRRSRLQNHVFHKGKRPDSYTERAGTTGRKASKVSPDRETSRKHPGSRRSPSHTRARVAVAKHRSRYYPSNSAARCTLVCLYISATQRYARGFLAICRHPGRRRFRFPGVPPVSPPPPFCPFELPARPISRAGAPIRATASYSFVPGI